MQEPTRPIRVTGAPEPGESLREFLDRGGNVPDTEHAPFLFDVAIGNTRSPGRDSFARMIAFGEPFLDPSYANAVAAAGCTVPSLEVMHARMTHWTWAIEILDDDRLAAIVVDQYPAHERLRLTEAALARLDPDEEG